MHPASVSARIHEDVSHRLKHSATLDSLVDSRLRYNAAELRGVLKHSSAQTDECLNTLPMVDEILQVEQPASVSADMENEIKRLRMAFESELLRYQQRERLLIAQMNAMRDLESDVRGEAMVNVSISCKSLELNLASVPQQYDCVTWAIVPLEFGQDDKVLGNVQSRGVPRKGSSLEITDEKLELALPRAAGHVTLQFRFFARSCISPKSNFPLILGEWTSPLFIPCLKDPGTIETLLVTLDEVGIASFELVFHYVDFQNDNLTV